MKMKDLGQLVATRAVADLQENNQEFATFVNACLNRYLSNDWGVLAEDDKKMNDDAVWDRSVTTILFPGEY